LTPLIPKQIQAAKEIVASPSDQQKHHTLKKVGMRSPLYLAPYSLILQTNQELLAAYENLSCAMVPTEPSQALIAAAEKMKAAANEVRKKIDRFIFHAVTSSFPSSARQCKRGIPSREKRAPKNWEMLART